MPGVEAAATVFPLPLSGDGFVLRLRGRGAAGAAARPRRPTPTSGWSPRASSETMGIRVLRGRVFTAQDDLGSLPVVVVNQTMAEQIWPGENPLGKRFTFDGSERAGRRLADGRGGGGGRAPPGAGPGGGLGGLLAAAPETRRRHRWWCCAAAATPPSWPGRCARRCAVDRPRSAGRAGADHGGGGRRVARAPSRFKTVLLGLFAALALVLAAVGVYGVVSYSVTQRTHEIGIRMALGARRGRCCGMVLRQGMTLAVLGIALAPLRRALVLRAPAPAELLYGVSARDPVTFALVALVARSPWPCSPTGCPPCGRPGSTRWWRCGMSEAGPVLCPVCPEAPELTLWRSERAGATVHYCQDCCGVWVKREVVDVLGLKARADLLPLWIGPLAVDQPAHRACPACGIPMDRKACGKIVVDLCGPHGVWFDCQELDHFVSWLRDRAEAHLRAVGAPMPFYPSLEPPQEGGGCHSDRFRRAARC